MANTSSGNDLFPKTATDLLTDIIRYTEGRMSKNEITEKWRGMQWSNPELTEWARWQFREGVK